jgi:nucleoside phosphorylase
MVGIAAGSSTKTQGYGDILAPDQTFDFGAGRLEVRDGKFHLVPDPNPLAIHPRLRDRLRHWSHSRARLDEIASNWPAERPRTSLQLHVGPLGSNAAVLNAEAPLQEGMEHWRKLVGVEMEAYATHFACYNAVNPSTAFLCVKSISDFTAPKEDRWQPYARFTAAQFVYMFLTDEWDELHLSR